LYIFRHAPRLEIAQSDAKNLLDKLSKYKTEVLRFVTDLRVSFGNNQAEREIRMMTIQQKIKRMLGIIPD
jgi:hypothetical protein